jgi:L-ribulose-5-phosphate 4-epimerase
MNTLTISEFIELENAATAVRNEVAELHAELPRQGLVVWTSGNISARVPGTDYFVIKPSGVGYEHLTPQSMVLCDLYGNRVEGAKGSERLPSSDTAAHSYVYRHLAGVAGIVHTHSPYATAWAARHQAIPCVITAMADEFGGDIPCAPFAVIGDDSIGQAIVETLDGHRSRAVLLANHGVFAIGRNAREAVKAAVMCEDSARTVQFACQLGAVVSIAQSDIDRLYDRYQNVYGQPSDRMQAPDRTQAEGKPA